MKTYTGTKTINATPMTRGEYNALRGWTLPADEDGNDEGYLVEYTDGGKANHPDFAGYISWSPKGVFERAYSPVLPAYQQRVVDEAGELRHRIAKLTDFIAADKSFSSIPAEEQARLKRQLVAMNEYLLIINDRIGAFE